MQSARPPPPPVSLSFVMPCHNEVQTIRQIVPRVLEQPFDIELIIVDDGSTDGTRESLQLTREHSQIRLLLRRRNEGQGSALRRGVAEATKDVVLVRMPTSNTIQTS